MSLQGNRCEADQVLRHGTGDRAVMNASVAPEGNNFLFAAGVDDSSQIFRLKYKVVKKKDGQDNSGRESLSVVIA